MCPPVSPCKGASIGNRCASCAMHKHFYAWKSLLCGWDVPFTDGNAAARTFGRAHRRRPYHFSCGSVSQGCRRTVRRWTNIRNVWRRIVRRWTNTRDVCWRTVRRRTKSRKGCWRIVRRRTKSKKGCRRTVRRWTNIRNVCRRTVRRQTKSRKGCWRTVRRR